MGVGYSIYNIQNLRDKKYEKKKLTNYHNMNVKSKRDCSSNPVKQTQTIRRVF